jgi:hypothetical protein
MPIKAMFLTKEDETTIPYFKSDWPTRIGLIICMLGLITTGFFGQFFEFVRSLSFGL